MKGWKRGRSPRRAGVTLIEALLATSVFLVIGGSLTMAAVTAQRSHAAVMGGTMRNRSLRESASRIRADLRAASDATVTVGVSADGNAMLTIQCAIEVGGNQDWGVEVETPGANPPLQPQPNWSIRYTVVSVAQPSGPVLELRRQILDAAGAVQQSATLARGLRSGADQPPGFGAVLNGAVWEITLSVDEGEIGSGYRTVGFHASTRN